MLKELKLFEVLNRILTILLSKRKDETGLIGLRYNVL